MRLKPPLLNTLITTMNEKEYLEQSLRLLQILGHEKLKDGSKIKIIERPVRRLIQTLPPLFMTIASGVYISDLAINNLNQYLPVFQADMCL